LQQYSTMRTGVFRVAISHPGDVSAVERLILTGALRAREVAAGVGKTEGSGVSGGVAHRGPDSGGPVAVIAGRPATSRSTSCAS
jgi:hypothetical protein